jgi:hypothetical protein
VGDQNHRPFDLLQFVLDCTDPCGTVELVGFKRRDTAYFAEFGLKQCLPMLGYVLTQARHDQNGCDSLQFVHISTYAFSMTRLTQWSEAFCSADIKERPPPALFIGRQSLFFS